MPYIPKVHDYVEWDKGHYGKDIGWVYFYDDEYITIETGIRLKPECELTHSKHRYIHTLVVCHNCYWGELKYIKYRHNCKDEDYFVRQVEKNDDTTPN